MLTNLIAGIFILTGFIFLVKPDRLRKKLQKKGTRTVKRVLFAMGLCVGSLIIAVSRQFEGSLQLILFIVGIIGIMKTMFMLRSKTADAIALLVMNMNVKYLRAYAIAQICFGILLILAPRG